MVSWPFLLAMGSTLFLQANPTPAAHLAGEAAGFELVALKAPSSGVLYLNEFRWLTALRGSGIIAEPLVFLHDRETLVLAHAGAPVTAATLPPDWAPQLRAVLATLRAHKCQHNDLKPSELLVDAAGKLRLIDFGFASYVCSRGAYFMLSRLLLAYVYTRSLCVRLPALTWLFCFTFLFRRTIGEPMPHWFEDPSNPVTEFLGDGFRCPRATVSESFDDSCTMQRVRIF